MRTASRRDFLLTSIRQSLRYSAASGLLLPALNTLLSQKVYAQQAPIKRVVFFYWPNGHVKEYWQPENGEGPISNDRELNFILSPLQTLHDKIVVCKNIYMSGVPNGGPQESSQNFFAAMRSPGDLDPTIDHALAIALQPNTPTDVLNLGVRTSYDSRYMISKRVQQESDHRNIPVNDPKTIADNLFGPISSVDPAREQILETVLHDIEHLKSIDVNANVKNKIDEYENSLATIQNQLEMEINGCGIKRTQITDPYLNGETAPDYAHWQHIPKVVKAQIDNAVTALACGVTNIATLQMMKAGVNHSLANMSFDGCWEHIEAARELFGATEVRRWWNEHDNYVSSHNLAYSNVGQNRWFVEQFAYLVNELKRNQLLGDTLAVMISNCGDGNENGPMNGGVVVAGGTGGGLQTGRIIDCNNTKTTEQLFMDIGTLMGVNLSGVNGWESGGLLV